MRRPRGSQPHPDRAVASARAPRLEGGKGGAASTPPWGRDAKPATSSICDRWGRRWGGSGTVQPGTWCSSRPWARVRGPPPGPAWSRGSFPVQPRDRRVARTPAVGARAPTKAGVGGVGGGRKEEVSTGGQEPFLAPLDHFPPKRETNPIYK